VALDVGFIKKAAGSCLVAFGDTRVVTTVCVEDRVPPHRAGRGAWLSAEYAMLPASTRDRKKRDGAKPDGRGVEIQRLVGRALRSVVDLDGLPPVTFWVDCDVIEADGGTRCASVTGAWVALAVAMARLGKRASFKGNPRPTRVASAVSVGLVKGQVLVDLNYEEDSQAEVDLNVVSTDGGQLVEVSGAAEKGVFARDRLDAMLDAGLAANRRLQAMQVEAVARAAEKL
jgi:ribonuclease PH